MRSSPISDDVGRWFAWLRVAAVPLAAVQVLVGSDAYPGRYGEAAWLVTALFAAAALALLWVHRRGAPPLPRRLAYVEIVFDTLVVTAYAAVFAFDLGQPLWSLFFLPPLEAAVRLGLGGGVASVVPVSAGLAAVEAFRANRFEPTDVRLGPLLLRIALALLVAVVAGRLVDELAAARRRAEARAREAEVLRDELGRRVDVLEAANRCARALASSLELEEAFTAFIRELGGIVPFARVAIVLAEDGQARVIAAAGAGEDTVFPPGTARPAAGSLLERVLAGELVVRADLDPPRYPEEEELLALGLRSRVAVPMLLGARTVGMLAVSREEPSSFRPEELELLSLLGRLVATAVQNIRAYEAERSTVEELRRLSALRADFVSLVSHELRSPMAAVIGSARTLQQRWRELSPEQRESFLELIAGETTRLATLVGDVLDTSRIDAGTFSYRFSTLDVGELVRDTAAAASAGLDEVSVAASVSGQLPPVRGDRDRLRQVLANLIDNAVKYSPAGEPVRVEAYRRGDEVLVEVADGGPGIAREHQRLIFEKFGRVAGADGSKPGTGLPGTGLGLFIARSIAEAHGGTLEVRSAPPRGATFTLALPSAD